MNSYWQKKNPSYDWTKICEWFQTTRTEMVEENTHSQHSQQQLTNSGFRSTELFIIHHSTEWVENMYYCQNPQTSSAQIFNPQLCMWPKIVFEIKILDFPWQIYM
jgi:hypothetical protein